MGRPKSASRRKGLGLLGSHEGQDKPESEILHVLIVYNVVDVSLNAHTILKRPQLQLIG